MTESTSPLTSLAGSILSVFKNAFDSIVALLHAILASITTAISSAVDLLKAFANFFISNLFLMLIVGAGFVGYSVYTQRRRAGQGNIIGSGHARPLGAGEKGQK
ncbi:hypothetical protein BDZ91DRAFT_735412 [Kalaharituber pfeilii]|nr:hypothetical protein BDZ91DRAFT_735412 [Kalaharituber pfeilii]